MNPGTNPIRSDLSEQGESGPAEQGESGPAEQGESGPAEQGESGPAEQGESGCTSASASTVRVRIRMVKGRWVGVRGNLARFNTSTRTVEQGESGPAEQGESGPSDRTGGI